MTTATAQISPYPDIAPPTDAGQTAENTDLVLCDSCGRYGWHTTDRCPEPSARALTTAQINFGDSEVPLPPGAEADIWMDDGYRDIYATVGTVLTSGDIMKCPLVTATARQQLDGRLDHITVDIDDGATSR